MKIDKKYNKIKTSESFIISYTKYFEKNKFQLIFCRLKK